MQKTILLTQGKSTIVDSKDFNYLNQFKWYFMGNGRSNYAVRSHCSKNGKHSTIFMHRVILERQGIKLEGMETDHINRNGLDNRRENLRMVTVSQNQQNSTKKINNKSGYKGIVFRSDVKKWRAQIGIDGKPQSLGYFKDKIQAAIVYNETAKKLFGEYANINNIQI